MADAQGLPELDPALTRARFAAQLLHRRERRTPAEIVHHLLAVQGQEFRWVPHALRARGKGFTRADVHAALDSGELLITWLNRGTLHLVCRDDFPWLLELTRPPSIVANRRRLEQEGVSETAAEKAVKLVTKLLADGPMLRSELREALRSKAMPHAAPAATHILFMASLRGVIVRGPVRGREQTFALTADHFGALPKVDRTRALRELGRRYLAGHSPATDVDLAYWAGIPLRDARAALAGAKPPPPARPRRLPPRLLPSYDPYIMGWKERSFAIPTEHTQVIYPGGGMFRPAIVIDGRVAGTWTVRAGVPEIQVLDRPDVDLTPELEDITRFG